MPTKLEKFLIKSSRNIVEASSTYSFYYYVGNLKIRVSDHFKDNEDNSDLYIINPVNKSKTYIVTIPGSKKVLNWNAQQIINYIPFLQIQKELLTITIKTPQSSVKSLAQEVKEAENLKIQLPLRTVCVPGANSNQNKIIYKTKSVWTNDQIDELPELLKRNLKLSDVPVLNDDFKLFLMTVPCTYKQAMNIYNIIVTDNKQEITLDLLNAVYSKL